MDRLRGNISDVVIFLCWILAAIRPLQGSMLEQRLEITGGDPNCFDGGARTFDKCCSHAPHTGPCMWGGILSHGYCCVLGADCYARGVVIRGDDVQDPVFARSGLECRHLCQSSPVCEAWTFVMANFELEDLRFSCWLKTRHWTETEASNSVPGALSGTRHCPSKHADVLDSMFNRQTLDLNQETDGSVVQPHEDPGGYAIKAANSLLHHGWVAIRGAIDEKTIGDLGSACERAVAELLPRDQARVGNRGPRRYSLGSASRTHHMAHIPEWARMLDDPIIAPVLRLVFQDDYVAIGGGGDVVLEYTDTVQWLHVDLPRMEMYAQARPPPGIGINFAVHDVKCEEGAMRLVPDTHLSIFQLDKMAPHNETAMLEGFGLKRVFVCPLRRGDVVIRDLRLWHAGSANLGAKPRLSPNVEYLANWFADITANTDDHLAPRKSIPRKIWEQLSPHAQRITAKTVADEPLETGFYDEIGLPQQFD